MQSTQRTFAGVTATAKSPVLQRDHLAIGVVVILHTVGIAGMLSEWRELFMALTPVNLIISAIVVGTGERHWNRQLIGLLAGCFVAGYLVEVAGVATGVIFGAYQYGETLGFKLFEVPLVIGLNWAVLVYCTGMMTKNLPAHPATKAALAAALMTGLDFFMEPVAIALDFWSWDAVAIPTRNYIAWFLIAYVMLRFFHMQEHQRVNRVAIALYVVQSTFFAALWALL